MSFRAHIASCATEGAAGVPPCIRRPTLSTAHRLGQCLRRVGRISGRRGVQVCKCARIAAGGYPTAARGHGQAYRQQDQTFVGHQRYSIRRGRS